MINYRKCRRCGDRIDIENEPCTSIYPYTVKGKLMTTRVYFCNICEDHLDDCGECGETFYPGLTLCKCGKPSGKFVLRDYHSGDSPKFKGDAQVRFGLEMEVGGGFQKQNKALTAAGFTEADVYAEKDSTVDVEWITRPLGVAEAPEFIRRIVTALAKGGACASGEDDDGNDLSCGCHHNVDLHALNKEGWGYAVIAINTFYSELAKFSPDGREYEEYASVIEVGEDTTPSAALRAAGDEKMVSVSFRKKGLVEFRLPGMSMDPAQMVTQFKLYSNLIQNIPKPGFTPYVFKTAFGPFDDEMTGVLTKLGVNINASMGATAVEPGAPRRGLWDIRKGDTVRFLSPDEVWKYHGLPEKSQDNLMDGFTKDLRHSYPGQYKVKRLLSDNGDELAPVMPALKRVVLDNGVTTCVGHLLAWKSGDGSKLLDLPAGPLVTNPPVHPEYAKYLEYQEALKALADSFPAASATTQPRARRATPRATPTTTASRRS
jgi:hypothetical protein